MLQDQPGVEGDDRRDELLGCAWGLAALCFPCGGDPSLTCARIPAQNWAAISRKRSSSSRGQQFEPQAKRPPSAASSSEGGDELAELARGWTFGRDHALVRHLLIDAEAPLFQELALFSSVNRVRFLVAIRIGNIWIGFPM